MKQSKKEAGHLGQPGKLLCNAFIWVVLLYRLCTSGDYASHCGRLGGHNGIGPDGAGAFGTAAYANVPTRPTNSSNALSERFMFTFSLGSAEKQLGDSHLASTADYTHLATFSLHWRLRAGMEPGNSVTEAPIVGQMVRQAIVKGFPLVS